MAAFRGVLFSDSLIYIPARQTLEVTKDELPNCREFSTIIA